MASRAQRVTCPWCAAAQGEPCTSPSGPRLADHAARWHECDRRMRHEPFVVRIRETDERLGVTVGEEYVAVVYWLDYGDKCTLLRRIPDGHNPECNQYWRDVEWLRWADERSPR